MTDTKTTAEDLATTTYLAGPNSITKETDYQGNVELTLGGHRIVIGDEYEDDGETIWGWTWTTYERITGEEVGPTGTNWEPMNTNSTQDEAEAAADLAAWLAAAEA